jgi:hypothetical protein
MTRKVRRWTALVSITIAALFSAASAEACLEPTLAVWPHVAAPGDEVSYSLTGLDATDRYTVRVGGQPVTPELTADGPTASGKFRMPDTGGQLRDASANVLNSRDDFNPVPPAQSPEPVKSVSAPQATPGVSDSPSASGTTSTPSGGSRSPDTEAQPALPFAGRGSVAGRDSVPQSGAPTPHSARTPAPLARAQRTATRPARIAPGRSDPAVTRAPLAHPARVTTRAPLRRALPESLPAPGRAEPAPLITGGHEFPLPAIVLGVALMGAAVFLMRSRRPPAEPVLVPAPHTPDPPSLPDIEAELQELIAEQHAREAARERAPTPV